MALRRPMATAQELLDDARAAYHSLMTGRAVAEVRDQNGETIRYTKADTAALANYIAKLENEIAGTQPSGPMRVWF